MNTESSPPPPVSGDQEFLYVFQNRSCHVFNDSGRRLGTCETAQRRVWGRYFLWGSNLIALSWNGVRFDSAHLAKLPDSIQSKVLCVLNPVSRPGSHYLILEDLSRVELPDLLIRCPETERLDVERIAAVSHDQQSVSAWSAKFNTWLVLDVIQGTRAFAPHPYLDTTPQTKGLRQNRQQLRHKFNAISAHRGVLRLRSFKGDWTAVGTQPGQGLVLRPESKGNIPKGIVPFRARDFAGLRLHSAGWADGSEAWLDGRGLLHLRSSDSAIPEFSFVLRDGLLAGWCADGSLFGRTEFHGLAPDKTAHYKHIEQLLERFLRRIR